MNVMQYMTKPLLPESLTQVGWGRSVSPSQASALLLPVEMLTNQLLSQSKVCKALCQAWLAFQTSISIPADASKRAWLIPVALAQSGQVHMEHIALEPTDLSGPLN